MATSRGQRDLRRACISGDVGAAEALLTKKSWSSWTSFFCHWGFWCSSAVACIDFVYDDDVANLPVHYICGAQPEFKGLLLWWDWVCGFFCTKSASEGTDLQRAQLLKWLLGLAEPLNLSVLNLRGENVLHCCVASNSVTVLSVVLEQCKNSSCAKEMLPSLNCVDAAGRTPLELAVSEQRWLCVRLLIGSGALENCPGMATARTIVSQMMSAQAGGNSNGKIGDVLGAFSVVVSDMFGISPNDFPSEEDVMNCVNSSSPNLRESLDVLGGSEELLHMFQQSVAKIQRILHLDEAASATLLLAHNYHSERAIQSYQRDAKGALASAGISDAPVSLPADAALPCIVCFETPCGTPTSQLPCGHTTCDDCWKGILAARLEEGDVNKTVCPAPDCQLCLPLSAVEKLLGKQEYVRFKELLSKRFVDAHPHLRWCPRPGCTNCVVLKSADDSTNRKPAGLENWPVGVECDCGWRFCWKCMEQAHEPATCNQVRAWADALDKLHKDHELQSKAWVSTNTMACPRCSANIQRNGGCNHMVCTMCGNHFCYKCGMDWKGHDDFYNCSRGRPLNDDDDRQEAAVDPPDAGGRKGLFSSICSLFNSVVGGYWWEWHVQQYSMHDCNDRHLNAVGAYMGALLCLGVPPPGDSSGMMASGLFDYLSQASEAVCSAREVLRNSYVLAFNMNRSPQRRYLEGLQSRLAGAVERLSFPLAQFPGFREVAEQAADNDYRATSHVRIVDDGPLIRRQFFYCIAVNEECERIKRLTSLVAGWKLMMLQAGRMGGLGDAIVQGKPSTSYSAVGAQVSNWWNTFRNSFA